MQVGVVAAELPDDLSDPLLHDAVAKAPTKLRARLAFRRKRFRFKSGLQRQMTIDVGTPVDGIVVRAVVWALVSQ
jgi:hypothetical protein